MVKFRLVSSGYNVAPWIEQTFMSVITQNLKGIDFEWVFVDDHSTDGTANKFRQLMELHKEKFHNITLMERTEKRCSLENNIKGITYELDEDMIVAILDGDDWFVGPNVIKTIVDVYEKEGDNCWLTYGSYLETPTYKIGDIYSPYSDHVIENNLFRKDHWHCAPTRTFRAKLFSHVDEKDFLDSNGNFFTAAGDNALMYPMLEMARERIRWLPQTMYVYNNFNPLNDHKAHADDQYRMAHEIRDKKPYERLESL